MPNPFPGMDPYLEGEMWTEFHHRVATEISAQLMPRLRPKYVALLEKHYALDERPTLGLAAARPRGVYPDVHVSQVREAAVVYAQSAARVSPPNLVMVSPMPIRMPILNVEVRDTAQRRLITVIEILSPANKYGGGFVKYHRKRTRLLRKRVHLLELDLLRLGTRIELIGELPPAAYYVLLSRWQNRPDTEVWRIALRASLPTVPVPLLPPDPDVPLDLQAALTACYDLVGYEQLLDYAEPLPELSADDAEWIETRLRTAGLRV